jgi:hypothetical protein
MNQGATAPEHGSGTEKGTGNREQGEYNVKMWKQPIPMLPITNVAIRIGYWVWALATFSHWHISFRVSAR